MKRSPRIMYLTYKQKLLDTWMVHHVVTTLNVPTLKIMVRKSEEQDWGLDKKWLTRFRRYFLKLHKQI